MIDQDILKHEKTAQPQLPVNPSPGQRILVVDDEPLICRLNSEVLRDVGYQVDTAGDGEAAWHLLRIRDYDLLITDNDMPKLTGIELLRRLHGACRTLPTIMATATLPYQEFRQHLWLESVVTLLKPYYIAELLERVRTVLRDTLVVGEYPLPLMLSVEINPAHARISA
jgi:DNA-binding response OmpR family regulator